jgi:superfamily II DNA or RNA helicase
MRTTANDETFKAISALKSKCKLIIIDEAHKAVAPTYKASTEFIANLEKTKIIGLTATPGRGVEEGETQELVEFFHRNKISLTDDFGNDIANPIKFLQDNRYLSEVVRREIASDVKIDLNEREQRFVATFLEIPTSVLNKLADDASRNALILGEIAALCADGCNVIVFALSVEHAHLLSELLNLRNIDARCVDGACTPYDRHRYIDDYKTGKVKVLVNYGVLTTGFDAPNTNAVLIARPTGSLVLYSQMIGRGIRGPRMGGNDKCILVDIKDNLVGFPDEKNAFTYFNDEWN